MGPRPDRRCSACFFTTGCPGVAIEADGRCTACRRTPIREELAAHLTSNLDELRRLADGWRAQRTGRYDCIVGGSGGLDSSYLAWIAKRLLGLEPLVVKYDHGFNHPAADDNVRALCRALGVDLEIVRSRGRHDWHYVRHVALALRSTGLYWGVCAFCSHAIQSVLYRTARREGVTVILGSHNLYEDRLHVPRSVKVEAMARALRGMPPARWPATLWHLALAAWHLLRLRLEFHVPPVTNLAARAPRVPWARHVTVSRYVAWEIGTMVRALEQEGWRAPSPALPMRFDCIIEDGLVNGTWHQATRMTVQGVIASNLVHAGVRSRQELEETVAHYEAVIPEATREVEERLGIR